MTQVVPTVYLAAHGETASTLTGQYNGLTDLPLTDTGELNARTLKRRLHGLTFVKVFTSPLQRDFRTCELAGFAHTAEIDSDLLEWNYGDYEGRTDAEIRAERPDWYLFRDGCPHGESPTDVTLRADRLVARLRTFSEHVLLFASPNFFRVLALRWIGFGVTTNAHRFALDVASVSAVGYDNDSRRPVIRLWNDSRHRSQALAQHESAT